LYPLADLDPNELENYGRIIIYIFDLQKVFFYNIIDFVYYNNTIKFILLSRLTKAFIQSLEFYSNTRKLLLVLCPLQCIDLYKMAIPIDTSKRSDR
jgi:hypothetical protein